MKKRPERQDHLAEVMSKVNEIMVERNISQAELARRMKTDRFSVNRALNLAVDVRTSTLVAMLKALDSQLTIEPNVQPNVAG